MTLTTKNGTGTKSLAITFVAILLGCGMGFSRDPGTSDTTPSPYLKLQSIDMSNVKWTTGFWADRFHLAEDVIIPHMWKYLNGETVSLGLTGLGGSRAWDNFRIAAGLLKGDFQGTDWIDGDFYKWLESVALVYGYSRNPELDGLMDKVIAVIAMAQQDDGYISTPITTQGRKRFQNLHHHELYNMGHLMTAAAVHQRATGKDSFLNVARKTGDYLYKTFKDGNPELAHFGFNPSNIMGAVDLYRTTRDSTYLKLAGTFVDMRGSAPHGTDQNQTRTPFREETEAVGHAVTGMYLYAGAADVYAETGDSSLLVALQRIWQDVHNKILQAFGWFNRNGI